MSDINEFLHREGLEKAAISKRAYALLIDSILLVILAVFVNVDLFTTLTPNSSDEEILMIQTEILKIYFPMAFIYQWLFVTLYGATLGKILMKIRVIDLQTGDNPTFLVALNRSAVRLVSELVMNLGFFWALLDPNRQGWHDKSSRTLVINA
jgi:uncharacterized RDD family membrane protein YckC